MKLDYSVGSEETQLGSKYNVLKERNANYMNYTALTFGSRKITYEEFHERVLEFTRALYKQGIRKGDKIAVCLENTPESVYLVYALDIIGAQRIGLSIFNNHFKMKRDIEQIKPQRVITTSRMYQYVKDPCKALNISPIMYDPFDFTTKFHNHDNLNEFVKEGEPFIVEDISKVDTTDIIFTGGSSGIHKGVELNGYGLADISKSTEKIFCLEPGMVHLGNIPFGHMVFGMFALQYALSNNLEYALTLKSLPMDFLEEIIRTKSNGAMGGPVHFDNLHGNPLLKEGSLSFFKQAATGGEMLKQKTFDNTMEAFKKGGSDATLINMLGLTEMFGLTHACIPGKNTLGTIGDPIDCIEDIVVDIHSLEGSENGKKIKLEEVEVGKPGLLLTKGSSMLLRYHNNEEETNKVFVTDENGERWYNTGDVVSRTGNTEKEIKFAGRIKRNFVSAYDNIYPEQVEELVLSIEEVDEVVVTKIPDDKYQYLPVYHIYLKNMDIDFNELEERINNLILNTLGMNALPGYIKYYDIPLPKTDNNKLNATLLEKTFIDEMNEKNNEFVKKRI